MLSRDRALLATASELKDQLWEGYPLDMHGIAGSSYRGISLGLPELVEKLSWKIFRKTFVAQNGEVLGFNTRLEQTGVDGPVRPRSRGGKAWTFGHFRVRRAAADQGPPGALLLDYGVRQNRLSPLGRLRDPLVAIERGSSDTLLGCSYLSIAGRNIRTPSFFLLERERD